MCLEEVTDLKTAYRYLVGNASHYESKIIISRRLCSNILLLAYLKINGPAHF
jgi:hypothetical protein